MLESIIAIPVIILFVLSVVTTYVAIGMAIYFMIRISYPKAIKTIESVFKKINLFPKKR
jgi:hypothetical protein